MTLATVVTARVSAQRLVHLTNPDLQAPTTVDSNRLGFACTEAEGEFEVHTGATFDEADPRHIAPAIDLVILLLQERGAAPTDTLGVQREKVIERLKDLAKVTGMNRVMAQAVEDDRSVFDESAFDQTTTDPQNGDEDDDE